MKTIEISNAKARRLAEEIAGRWASLSCRILATNVRVDNPLYYAGDTEAERRRALKGWKFDRALLAEVLVQLGASLPEPDRSAFCKPYRDHRKGGAFNGEMYLSAASLKEAKRLKSLVLASMG